MSLPLPSQEQQCIIDASVNNQNIIVNAVPGSGKTTTSLMIAHANKHRKILYMTFSKRLKDENRLKVKKYNIKNMESESFHSATKHFGPLFKACKNDDRLSIFLRHPPVEVNNFDILLIDEVQDVKPIIFQLIKYILACNPTAQIIALGDEHQSVYKFNNADPRFLTLLDKLVKRSFQRLSLHTSFRMPTQMAKFVSNVIMDRKIIINSDKPGSVTPSVHIWRINYDSSNSIARKLFSYMKSIDCKDGMFISNSVKTRTIKNKPLSPFVHFMNKLTLDKKLIYQQDNSAHVSERASLGKFMFLSGCASKGLERPYVFVMTFSDEYYELAHNEYKKSNIQRCDETSFVAFTRAQKELHIISIDTNNLCSSINKQNLYKMISDKDVILHGTISPQRPQIIKYNPTIISVTDFISTSRDYILDNILNDFIKQMFIQTHPCEEPLSISSEVEQLKNGHTIYEYVADITGILVNIIFADLMSASTYDDIIISSDNEQFTKYINLFKDIKMHDDYINNRVFTSILYKCIMDGTIFRLSQLSDYNWITQTHVTLIKARLTNLINQVDNPIIIFEQRVCIDIPEYNFNLIGDIDAYNKTTNTYYEIKCVNELTLDHYLQVILYWIMLNKDKIDNTEHTFILININTNEQYLFKPNLEMVHKIMILLCDNYKKCCRNYKNDNDFINIHSL